MDMTEASLSGTTLEFPVCDLNYKDKVASAFPPGMLAIIAALDAVTQSEEFQGNFEALYDSFALDAFKCEGDGRWAIHISVESSGYNDERSFRVTVVRDGDNYDAVVKT